jgi:hypothetical protein
MRYELRPCRIVVAAFETAWNNGMGALPLVVHLQSLLGPALQLTAPATQGAQHAKHPPQAMWLAHKELGA